MTTPEPAGLPREDGDPVDDAAAPVETAPGDGSVGGDPPPEVDAPRGFARGPEAAAARADTSDTTPTPMETHPG